jgi:hypothetical protein
VSNGGNSDLIDKNPRRDVDLWFNNAFGDASQLCIYRAPGGGAATVNSSGWLAGPAVGCKGWSLTLIWGGCEDL